MQTFDMKWAPTTLADVVYADNALRQYIDAYAKGEVSDHLLLWGEPGTGKTSIIDLLPAAFEASATGNKPWIKRFDVDEADAKILKSVENMCSHADFYAQAAHFVMFDEVDNLSKPVLNKLKGIIGGTHKVRLLMTTNNVGSLNEGMRNRATEFCVSCPTPEQFLARARHIVATELAGRTMPSDDLILAVLKKAHANGAGSVRNMLRRLELLVLWVQGKSTLNPLTM